MGWTKMRVQIVSATAALKEQETQAAATKEAVVGTLEETARAFDAVKQSIANTPQVTSAALSQILDIVKQAIANTPLTPSIKKTAETAPVGTKAKSSKKSATSVRNTAKISSGLPSSQSSPTQRSGTPVTSTAPPQTETSTQTNPSTGRLG